LRIWISAGLLALFWRPWRLRLPRKALLTLALYGASLGLMNLIFYLAIERIPLGLAVAIEFVGPLAVAISSSRRPSDFVWALLAALGIYLVLPISGASESIDPLGAFFAFAAGCCWGLYIIFGKKAGALVQGGGATALGMLAAGLVVSPVGLRHVDARLGSASVWILAFTIAVFSSALPYTLEMMALRKIPAKTFGILMSLEPALAAASGFALLGERLSMTQWAAIGSVIVASAGSSITSRAVEVVPEA
jgi:inner membrane transporter RhtA